MKNDSKNIIIGCISLIVILIVGLCVLKVIIQYVQELFLLITHLTSNVDAVIIVALITGSLSVLGVVISSVFSKVIEYRQNTKRYLYSKKEKPYSELIEMVYKMQGNIKNTQEYSETEMMKDMLNFSKNLTLWGSNRVIKKWLEFRKIGQKSDEDPTQNLLILEEIIFEIRKDMGQKKRGLKQGDILAFFVNDINEYLQKNKK